MPPALISGGLILGFRNVIGDLPMKHGQKPAAQMYPSLETIMIFCGRSAKRSDLPFLGWGYPLVSGEKNGRHADPWYRAWRGNPGLPE